MYTLQTCCLLVAAISYCSAQYDDHEEHYKEEHYPPKPYKFEYSVHDPHTHDIKEQQEHSDGKNVQGYYKLKESDGTERIVHYTADKHLGFVAHVNTIGKPHIQPEPQKHTIPAYASGFTSHSSPQAPQHKFEVYHEKHHAMSHQAVKIDEKHE